MGLQSKTLNRRGFTLIEMLTVIAISSGILVVLAALFKTGLWEVSKSSGRVEMVRNGRNALNNVQRYLSTAMPPIGIIVEDGTTLGPSGRAVFWPDTNMLHDPDNGNVEPWQQRVQFFTPIDHLGGTAPSSARQLTNNPVNFAYEIAAVPGANATSGQDLVLRKFTIPNPWPLSAPPLTAADLDLGVQPRLMGRRLGIPDSAAPGGFRDALEVRRLREGAIQLRVNVTVETISDDLNRNKALDATDTSTRNKSNTITMQTIFQPPYFNID
jgi:prepilin-type N-terminal cleavage/methylation domain-containing protein